MKINRMFRLISLVVIAGLALAACNTAAPGASKVDMSQKNPDVLKVWITWGDNPQQIQELFDRYGKANNVKVEVTAPVETDKVLAALTGTEPPDVLVLSGGELVKSYDAQGLVEPLDDYIKATNIDVGDIFKAPLDQCLLNGKTLCLPWGTDVYALFWNKDLFEAAGLDPNTPPKTLEELAQFADKLTKKNADGSLSQVGFIPDFSWGHSDLYTRMFGGFWYSEDGQHFTINSQPMLDALKWQAPFYAKYGADEVLKFTSALGGYTSPDQGFYAGKIAMMVDGEWQVGQNFIQKYKPELNYGVAAFPPPASNPERKNTGVVAGTVAMIPAGAKYKAASARLLAWMMSPEILAEEMYQNSNLPTSKKAAADPRFSQIPNFKVFLDLMADPNAKYVITTPVSLEWADEQAQIEEQVLHAGADPKPLLDAAQEKFEAKLQAVLNKK